MEDPTPNNVGAIPPGHVEVQPPPIITNTAPWRAIWGFGILAILDLAINAGAGAAAVRVGAQLNGVTPSTLAIQMGALAGLTKAATLTFREIVLMNHVNMVFGMLLFLITSSFGICPLLATEVGNIVLGETPKEFVVAAVVAAVPLFFETVRDIKPKPDADGEVDYFRWLWAIFLIPFNALGGYVFARMATNQGMPISNYSAACSAGAVYGTLTFLARAITGIVAVIRIPVDDGGHGAVEDIFGRWEVMIPNRIVVTNEEYARMRRGVGTPLGQMFKGLSRVTDWMMRGMACCCGCFLGREFSKELRRNSFPNDMEMGAPMGFMMAEQLLPAIGHGR
ncbi:hypothetical protein CkaCkLH20_12804 [Colletotrichum karsti]|uniref:Uncharacterized protein n=1 Tax=Colletotrichum karsti TaxID=1095194 RepID=A0A9P6LE69_9PEZI|nr:uncharacterized protein CkaCkLH20_12804 [Colletotrichum karsti]KAF9869761.1 hypothetical protein CkaCkLH20_12804 [Colletotrichum karsti]